MKWTDEQILKLQLAVASRGTKWSTIQKLDFPDLSVEAVRSAWKANRDYAVPVGVQPPKPPIQYERVAVIGDTQIPFQDDKAVDIALRVIDEFQPTTLVHLGDLCDMYELSCFAKQFSQNQMIKELAQSRRFLKNLGERYPKAKKKWILGNHEFRFDRFIADNARSLIGLRGMTLLEQIEPEAYGFEAIYSGLKESYWEYKHNLLIGHWNKVSIHSAYTAKALLRDVSLIQGHTHRLGYHCRNGHSIQLAAWENGCLCRLDPQYVLDPNWQQGFSLVFYDNARELFAVRQIAIQQRDGIYWAEYNGNVYEA
jgi:predicted phosphodiesterase